MEGKEIGLALAHLDLLPTDHPVDPPRIAVCDERVVDFEKDGKGHVQHA